MVLPLLASPRRFARRFNRADRGRWPHGVAAFPQIELAGGRRGWVAAVIPSIFTDGVEEESAIGFEAIAQRSPAHAIVRDRTEELRDQRGQIGRRFAMAQL